VSAITGSVAGRHELGDEYDTLDRLTRRTLDGADRTLYTYDKADRLAAISYRNQTTAYTWNAASRLTAKVLPNGIQQEFVSFVAALLFGRDEATCWSAAPPRRRRSFAGTIRSRSPPRPRW
jgi:YD repeat-containing protein